MLTGGDRNVDWRRQKCAEEACSNKDGLMQLKHPTSRFITVQSYF